MTTEVKVSKVEITKRESQQLRGSIAQELSNDNPQFLGGNPDLLKFHGIYQQDNRDVRQGKDKSFSLMIRGRIPGGKLSAQQYLVWDKVSSQYSNDNSLRTTTRQSLQLHGILKTNIKQTIADINQSLISTRGACGDIVRNVTQVENPWGDNKIEQLNPYVENLSNHFLANSTAYDEIWLDKTQINKIETEDFYGEQYLPRKFKISVTVAGNNSIDIYSNDMGFAASFDDNNQLNGFFVFAGGGMGMTHNKPATFARVADYLGWIEKSELINIASTIISIHRDFGNRVNRKNARLKYIVADKGVAWLLAEIKQRAGVSLSQYELPEWQTPSILGWHKITDNDYTYGLHLTAGRIVDSDSIKLKTGLATVVAEFNLDVQMCADQNILLKNINNQSAVEARLAEFGIIHQTVSEVKKRALACVSLPTCGLALNEGERALPGFLTLLEELLDKYQLSSRAPIFRVTGCANGCARPHTAELAFIGRTKSAYSIYVGGSREGYRIAKLFKDKVEESELPNIVEQLFIYWKNHSFADELLSEFIQRQGLETIVNYIFPEEEIV